MLWFLRKIEDRYLKMLRIKNLKCSYGSIVAVHGVSLSVKKGELISIIGANGSGKSTLLTAICGLLVSWDGEILFKEKSLKSLSPLPSFAGESVWCRKDVRFFSAYRYRQSEDGRYTRYRRGLKNRLKMIWI